jgi:hypothetical protein
MRILCKVAVILFVCSLFGCKQKPKEFAAEVSPQANPWTNLQFNNNPDNFQFAIVSDKNGGNRPGVFASAMSKLNLMQPEFVMSIGDLIPGYITDQNELDGQWDEFDELVNRLEMPFFYVPGNHDISNETMVQKWKERLGRPYYHFVYKNVLFLCLDTEDPPYDPHSNREHRAGVSEQQVEYFAKAIKDNPNVSWTFLFMHKPVWEDQDYTHDFDYGNWTKIEKHLQGRPYTVFAGHDHVYKHITRQGQSYYKLGTTGGHIPSDVNVMNGAFAHVVWITMGEKGPQIANLLLDGIVEPKLPGVFNIPVFTDLKRADTGDELSFSLKIENPLTVDLNVQTEWKKIPDSPWTITTQPEQLTIPPDSSGTLRFKASASRKDGLLPLPNCTLKFAAGQRKGENTFRLPLNADAYLQKILPTLTVKQYQAPIIDGKIDDPAWQRQPDIPGLLDKDLTTPVTAKTEGWICYDEDYYYVAVRCYEPLLDSIKTDAVKRDGMLWEDDSVEIFIDADNDRKEFHQVIVNSNAVIYDAVGFDFSFNTDVKAAASKDESSWIVEVAIPWADIKTKSPIKGTKMAFLLARTRTIKGEANQLMQYPPTNGNHHSSKFFGNLDMQ